MSTLTVKDLLDAANKKLQQKQQNGAGSAPVMRAQQDLLATVYQQCWPPPGYKQQGPKPTPPETPPPPLPKPSKEWIRQELLTRAAEIQQQHHQGAKHSQGQQESQQNDNRWKAWSSPTPVPFPAQVANDNQEDELRNVKGDKVYLYPDFYKLSHHEYKRLSDQVLDVRGQANRRFRGAGFKKYFTSDEGRNVSTVYRSQLANSMKAFNNKKVWTPYEDPHAKFIRPQSAKVNAADSPVSCHTVRPRPRTATIPRRPHTPSSTTPGRDEIQARPFTAGTTRSDAQLLRVSPRMNTRLPAEETPNPISSHHSSSSDDAHVSLPEKDAPSLTTSKFDSLTPNISYELSGGQVPESVYGDRPSILESQPRSKSCSQESLEGSGTESELAVLLEDKESPKPNKENEDVSSTSGIGTDKEESDDDSDDEDIPEPKLSEVEMSKVPSLNLRPEEVDNLNILIYPKGDRRKYDFDIENAIIPEYEFEHPLSEYTRDIDLTAVAKDGSNWRDFALKEPEDVVECAILDRLVEIEKLRKQTIEAEKTRREQARIAKERSQARSRLGGGRIQCARVWREKKCCLDCLQVCCVGDCNEHKKYSDTLCFQCDENHKSGSCMEGIYDVRSRGQEVEEERPKTPNSGMKGKHGSACPSCRRPNNAKYINANNIVLGRPKSGHATFARGQSSTKPKDLRSASGVFTSSTLEQDFDKLGLDPPRGEAPEEDTAEERPNTACSDRQRHFRGRVGVVPGKSYFSQRRLSLTDATTRERIKSASSTSARRKKSARAKKRPKTAGH